jgi:hypothetical protein
MNKAKNIFYTMLASILVVPAIVSAQYNPTDGQPDGIADATDMNEVILSAINWILAFLASLSVLMIVVAGIMYITSGGDESRTETAKKWLTYSIVGLVVALLSYVIVKTVSEMLI